jgi:membrane-bound lytic murein transglycosylase A
VRFAASNGHPYRSIGKLLVDEGRLILEEATLPGIEKYLHDHPEDMWRVLHANPRYIFFDWGKDEAIRGSAGMVLTPGRSIAVDPSAVPLGSVAFIMTRIPVFDEAGRLTGWRPLRRFVFPQDSGAAIKGPGRIDLFLGSGREARLAAGLMREDGDFYILLKK